MRQTDSTDRQQMIADVARRAFEFPAEATMTDDTLPVLHCGARMIYVRIRNAIDMRKPFSEDNSQEIPGVGVCPKCHAVYTMNEIPPTLLAAA